MALPPLAFSVAQSSMCASIYIAAACRRWPTQNAVVFVVFHQYQSATTSCRTAARLYWPGLAGPCFVAPPHWPWITRVGLLSMFWQLGSILTTMALTNVAHSFGARTRVAQMFNIIRMPSANIQQRGGSRRRLLVQACVVKIAAYLAAR